MREPQPEVERVRTRLSPLLGEIGSIDPLPSGAGGTSYRIRTPRGQFVAKDFPPDAPVLLDARAQFALLEALSAGGVAPRPVACAHDRLLVTEFVEGEVASAGSLRRGEGIDALAGLLRRLHTSACDVPPFAPLDYAERYLARLGGRSALSAADRERYKELLALAATPLPGPACLCHNDLTADNLLLGARPRLLDFDYAAMATPILDLASAVFMNELPPPVAGDLQRRYHGGPAPYSAGDFARVRRLLGLLAHFWSLAVGQDRAAVVARYRIRDV